MDCRIIPFYLCILASQWYRIVSCFTLFPRNREIQGLSSFRSGRLASPRPWPIHPNNALDDGSTERHGLPTVPPSSVISRLKFLTVVLVTIPMCAAESVASPEITKETKEEPVAKERSLAKTTSSTKEESISGFVAGAALTLTKTIVKYPMDTATVRLQMPQTNYTMQKPLALFEDAYVGIAAPLVANVPAGAVFFAVKDAVQASLPSIASSRSDTSFLTALCGSRVVRTCVAVAVAQLPYWIVRNPSEVFKTRQQAGLYQPQEEEDLPVLPSWRRLWASTTNRSESNTTTAANGLAGWYTGYWENVLYAYPADVLKFVCYEQLSSLFELDPKELHPAESALYGAIATASAQWITTPLDVVRNRVMAQSGSNATMEEHSTFWNSYANLLWRLARDEGTDGLFAGVTPRVMKAFLSGAIQFATYEETKQAIATMFSNGGRP
jgi:solute carrier family 25 (mitochondrial S-adenosylmethionine transporter), member 26